MKNCLSISSSTLICSLSLNVTGHTQNSRIWLKFWYWPQSLKKSKIFKIGCLELVKINYSKLGNFFDVARFVVYFLPAILPVYSVIWSNIRFLCFFIWSSGFGLLTQLEQVWKHCDKSRFRYFFKDNIKKDLLYKFWKKCIAAPCKFSKRKLQRVKVEK